MKYLTYIYCFFALVLLAGCETETMYEDVNTDYRYDYSPLTIGHTRQYKVDSILFKIGVSGLERDTQSYIFQETVVDTFESVAGGSAYITEQEKIHEPTGAVSFHQYSSRIDNNTLIVSSNNISIIPFVFPPRFNRSWDGLSLFDASAYIKEVRSEPIVPFKDWTNFRIIEVDGNFELDGQLFEDVITILQTDAENAIEKRYALERYAPDIGLIYREQIILDTQNITDDPWEEKAERGFILYQTLIAP